MNEEEGFLVRGAGGRQTSRNEEGKRGPKTGRQRVGRGEAGFVYNRVRSLRAERGLSRVGLAEDLGVGHQALGYLEREEHQPSLTFAWEISGHFGLPLEAVFSPEPMRPLSEMVYGGGGDEAATPPRGES